MQFDNIQVIKEAAVAFLCGKYWSAMKRRFVDN